MLSCVVTQRVGLRDWGLGGMTGDVVESNGVYQEVGYRSEEVLNVII